MRHSENIDSQAATFILVRHGQTIWNAQGRWQGWLDSPLTEEGIEQARSAAARLSAIALDDLFCSATGRAIQTAEIIGEMHGLRPRPVEQLRERYYGSFEGLDSAEIEKRYPRSRYERGRDTRENWRPPGGGESMVEVRARVEKFLVGIAPQFRGKTAALVTHSGVVRVVDSLCAHQPLDEIWERVPPNGCVFFVKYSTASGFTVAKHFCPLVETPAEV